MLDFTFEIVGESAINTRILYASEWFTFNIYRKDDVWTLHPFEGILIQNKDMCRLVIADLLKNKYFHVMCAKENILLSELQTSINLQAEPEEIPWIPPRERQIIDHNPFADMQSFIENHSIEDIVELEKQYILNKMSFYKQILESMFMEGYGPTDDDFKRIQSIVAVWSKAYDQLNAPFDQDSSEGSQRRW
ncbi:hypothetical protein [Paenibacillus eucommiae]|uniref:Uncharacterized protein n=1 Tax=Paenibacillus eucommiae TaxID=1355755 RepID=A0ABS4J0Y6_9BACL|nr:hypothetical protein [Paenibacillus eucommiae]MBP1993485.1 hypothetical protein [Paenibacillus eucommiae]